MDFTFIKIFDYLAFAFLFIGILFFALKIFLKPKKKWLGITLLLFSILIFFGGILLYSGSYFLQKKSGVNNVDRQARNFNFKTATGDQIKNLSDYKGKIVILNFWATWCAPCIEEMPDLSDIATKYREQDVIVLAISDEDGETVRNFLERNDFDFETGYLNTELPEDLPEIFNNTVGRPTTFFIDKQGTVKKVFVGATAREVFENSLKELF